MTAILSDNAASALWHDLVRDAEQRGGATLDSELESYLVFVLMRHLHDAQLARAVFAIDYLDALNQTGGQRCEELRDLGDRCLIIAGLFPQQAQRRHVSLDYFLDLGSRAYAELGESGRAVWADLRALYARAAQTFTRLVRVLVEVRRLAGDASLDAMARHALCLRDRVGIEHEFPGGILLGSAGTRLQ